MPLRPPSPLRPRVRHWLHLICKRKNLKARQFRSFGKLFSTNGKMPLALSPQSGGGQLLLITPPNSRNWDHNQEGVSSWLITPPNSRNWDHNQEGVNSCCSSPQATNAPDCVLPAWAGQRCRRSYRRMVRRAVMSDICGFLNAFAIGVA